MDDPSVAGLRVLREVAERNSFTAAAVALGYTQSAVSRQIAALERQSGHQLFERRPEGARLTPAGRTLLRHAAVVLEELAAADRALGGRSQPGGRVRLGMFTSAGAVLMPRVLARLSREHPGIEVTSRDGSTPVLVRALRAGTLDLAVIAGVPPFRAPDQESPALKVETLTEGTLLIAVPSAGALGLNGRVRVKELTAQSWISSPSASGDETLLGVWPGLAGRPRIAHTTRDWLAKLELVAAGCGITSVPRVLAPAVPAGVRLVEVDGGSRELRRVVLARRPGRNGAAVADVARILRETAALLAAEAETVLATGRGN